MSRGVLYSGRVSPFVLARNFFRQGLLRSLLAGALLLGNGCNTTKIERRRPSGADWQIQQGQAVWRPSHKRPELSGDLLVATRPDGSFVFDFSKTPLPITAGQATSTNWLIEFPARHYVFSGKGEAPNRFAWLYLRAALAGQSLPKNFKFTRQDDGGWRLENLKSGEFIEGFLTP